MNQKGAILFLVFVILLALTAVTVAFLSMTSGMTRGSGSGLPSAQALWAAEAGFQRAIWNLKTPVASGGKGRDWVTPPPLAANFGNGAYTVDVSKTDFALSTYGSTAAASSQSGNAAAPANAIDNDNATYWESQNAPANNQPQTITIQFPRPLAINRARFFLDAGTPQNRPMNYNWQVSANNNAYTTVVTVTNNALTDVTNTFNVRQNVLYLRLRVTRTPTAAARVRAATIESVGSTINALGVVGDERRHFQQTFVFDNTAQRGYQEPDWNEIFPA